MQDFLRMCGQPENKNKTPRCFLCPSTRGFTGPTNEVTIINQINTMAELLDSPGVCVNDSFMVAGYTNPAHSNRQNEIWFLERR